MSDVANVLRKARDLYAANPSHALWAYDIEPGANCVVSAVWGVPGVSDRDILLEAERALYSTAQCRHLATWNAAVSTETVLAAFDKAITEADNA